MKDRLIEILRAFPTFGGTTLKQTWMPEAVEKLADHLLSEGVIVPPCKVGDTVYRIVRLFNGIIIIVEGIVVEFAITHESSQNDKNSFYFWEKADTYGTSREYSTWCEFADFGKTVFLTREEAEKAVERGENGT